MPAIRSVPTGEGCPSSDAEDSSGNFSFAKSITNLLFILLLCGFSIDIYCQRKTDIGFFAGTSTYMGDINSTRLYYAPGHAIGPVVRYNFDLRNSLRLGVINHRLQGNDLDFSDPLQLSRGSAFQSNYIDLAAAYEFNFLPYKTADRKYKRSLYLSGGIGYHFVISSNTLTNNHLIIPFGLGYKLNLTKKMSAGAEISVRKTFNDKIDGVENFALAGDKHLFGNNDWYTFAGIFITYKIFNFREDCPAYEKNRSNELKKKKK